LILFAWLHLILGLQIASTGREIQVTTEELEKFKRDNLAIMHQIAVAESQENTAARAVALGYGPQAPLYLPVAQPFARTITGMESGYEAQGVPALAASGSYDRSLSQFLLDYTPYHLTAASETGTEPPLVTDTGLAKRQP
jgi:hypothetical protein